MQASTLKAPQVVTEELEEKPEVALLDAVLEQTAKSLDATAIRYHQALQAAHGNLRRALILADGISKLRGMLDDKVMGKIMSLMNSPLGFKTDRPSKTNPQLYPKDVVRDCVISALLQGVCITGNEFNIIAESCYVTQNGYRRKVRELPGLTDLIFSPGVPTQHNGQTVVRCALSWNLLGEQMQLRGADGQPGLVIPIITNQYTSVDAIIGKATRKAYRAAFEQVVGSDHTAPDAEVGEILTALAPVENSNGKSRTEQLSDKLAERGAAVQPNEAEKAPEPEPTKEPAQKPPEEPAKGKARKTQVSEIIARFERLAFRGDEIVEYLDYYGVTVVSSLTPEQADEVLKDLREKEATK